MKKLKILFSIFSTALFLSSCEKVLNVDLNASNPNVVIEGLITDKPGPYIVKVTMTADYYQNQPPPAVSNALVIISDNIGNIDTLIQTSPGVYKTKTITGVKFRTYTLTVNINGKIYSAISTLPDLYPVDSLGYTYYAKRDILHHKGYYPLAYSVVPQNVENYYLWKFFRNDTLLNSKRQEIWVADDKSVKASIRGLEFPYAYQLHDTASVKVFSITK
ncbi:MAG TPA: DUF4249 family protein, partial [Cytophagaceae bacterium]|nr:DUF4249 family protein [Cytophagaceae bacterium]